MIRTPNGVISAAEVEKVFEQCGFEPPPGMPLQQAFMLFMRLVQEQQGRMVKPPRAVRGRTAVPCTIEEVPGVFERFGASLVRVEPFGAEIRGVDATKPLPPELAGAMEMQMAHSGFLLLRGQGTEQCESGVKGRYLTGEQQCAFTESFGPGELHSTHGVHEKSPCRDVFRLSNDPDQGFNQVGPEWHNDGSFCRDVFGHVGYHIIKAPAGRGDTRFAHLGAAYDALPPAEQDRYSRCASVNSNGGVLHPLVHDHPISKRRSLYLHTGMTGAIIERVGDPPSGAASGSGGDTLEGLRAWPHAEMDQLFRGFTAVCDLPDICYSHKWEEGDMIIIDNLAVAHKAAPGAHVPESGLRILHRTTGKGMGPLDPDPKLRMPLVLDTAGPCPFSKDAVWVEGYVGFRWGKWQERTTPH